MWFVFIKGTPFWLGAPGSIFLEGTLFGVCFLKGNHLICLGFMRQTQPVEPEVILGAVKSRLSLDNAPFALHGVRALNRIAEHLQRLSSSRKFPGWGGGGGLGFGWGWGLGLGWGRGQASGQVMGRQVRLVPERVPYTFHLCRKPRLQQFTRLNST